LNCAFVYQYPPNQFTSLLLFQICVAVEEFTFALAR
jgi:hypothetical protein